MPNMTGDMIKKVKIVIFKKMSIYVTKMQENAKFDIFWKSQFLNFFIISPVIFGLQRPTLPQIKALEILYWPYFIIFSPHGQYMLSNYVENLYHFFTQSLELRKQFLSHILILRRFDKLFSFFYEFLHFRQTYWCIWFHKKRKIMNLIPFHKQNFQIHFVNVFLTHPLLHKFTFGPHCEYLSIKVVHNY